jgi:predicted nuclease of predicted toxin-antitoxin system
MIKFIVDECTGPSVGRFLVSLGYDVYSVSDASPGWKDEQVLQKANAENWILVTNDKDFGELIFKQKLQHSGVTFMRLEDERITNKIIVLKNFFENYPDLDLSGFVVLTEKVVRLSKFPTN